MIMLFEPQPFEYFNPLNLPTRIMTLKEKLQGLQTVGLDYVCIVKFNNYLATLAATKFVIDILVSKLNISQLVIGYDFRFGYKRLGDVILLQEMGKKNNFIVSQIDAFHKLDMIASSSLLRKYLLVEDFHGMRHILGREYSISCKVNFYDNVEHQQKNQIIKLAKFCLNKVLLSLDVPSQNIVNHSIFLLLIYVSLYKKFYK